MPLLGWRAAAALSATVDIHLVTQVRNRAAIEGASPAWPCTFIDTEDLAAPLYRLGSFLRGGNGKAWTLNSLLGSASYRLFEHRAWLALGSRVRAGAFDIVHRITPVSPGFASPIAAKCVGVGVPFVLGPINGGIPWPAGFEAERGREKELLSMFRSLHRWMPGYESTRRNSAAIMVGSSAALEDLPVGHRRKAMVVPENAVLEREVVCSPRDFSSLVLRVVFVGRLVPLKGVSMLIDAFKVVSDRCSGSLTLDIVGDGPERLALERAAGGRSDIRFLGSVGRAAVMTMLRESHLLAFPSIREFGGGVVVEAMASGAVPVVVDYGGPHDLVPEGCGIRVAMTTRDGIVAEYASVLGRALQDREWLAAMSGRGIDHVRSELTWEAKARGFVRLYEKLLAL